MFLNVYMFELLLQFLHNFIISLSFRDLLLPVADYILKDENFPENASILMEKNGHRYLSGMYFTAISEGKRLFYSSKSAEITAVIFPINSRYNRYYSGKKPLTPLFSG